MAHPQITRFTSTESALAAPPVESLPRCPGNFRGTPGWPYVGLPRATRLSLPKNRRKEER